MRIKEYREKAGMTQKQLADMIHLERSAIAKWESGAVMPAAARLPELATALGVSVDDLFDRDDNDGPAA